VPNDPHFGLTAYGGTVELDVLDGVEHYVVVPQDGLRRRLSVVGQRFQANLRAHQYSEARIRTDFMGVEFDIENPSGLERTGYIEIRMLQPGAYHVYVDGVREDEVFVVGNDTDRNNLVLPTLFSYSANGDATQTVRIINVSAALRDELVTLLDEANDLGQDRFTAANWRLFLPALNNAQRVLDNPNSTDAEIAQATNTLRNMVGRAR
jgi:hypothetical protein